MLSEVIQDGGYDPPLHTFFAIFMLFIDFILV